MSCRLWPMADEVGQLLSERKFSAMVAGALKVRGLSEKWLAQQLGMHPQTLRGRLHSKPGYSWQPGERERAAEALGTTLDDSGLLDLDRAVGPVGLEPTTYGLTASAA